jgi:hypothetical protein
MESEGFCYTCWETPDGYLTKDGVSGRELREGDSSGLSSVCTWRPMVLERVDESSAFVRCCVCGTWKTRAEDDLYGHSRLL